MKKGGKTGGGASTAKGSSVAEPKQPGEHCFPNQEGVAAVKKRPLRLL